MGEARPSESCYLFSTRGSQSVCFDAPLVFPGLEFGSLFLLVRRTHLCYHRYWKFGGAFVSFANSWFLEAKTIQYSESTGSKYARYWDWHSRGWSCCKGARRLMKVQLLFRFACISSRCHDTTQEFSEEHRPRMCTWRFIFMTPQCQMQRVPAWLWLEMYCNAKVWRCHGNGVFCNVLLTTLDRLPENRHLIILPVLWDWKGSGMACKLLISGGALNTVNQARRLMKWQLVCPLARTFQRKTGQECVFGGSCPGDPRIKCKMRQCDYAAWNVLQLQRMMVSWEFLAYNIYSAKCRSLAFQFCR